MSSSAGLAVIVSSPSGGGKTTVVDALLKKHADWIRSISTTTRAARAGEENGRDYFFVSSEQFENLKIQNGFLESAQVFQNQYGTPRLFVESQVEQGKVVFLTVDVQGAEKIKKVWTDPASLISVFIMPTSLDILRQRLLKRNTETPAQIEVRLAAAKREMEQARLYDFTVYNHSLDQTVGEIEKLIVDKVEKRRSVL
jgi:guanylate kinase